MMKRREFVKSALVLSGGLALGRELAFGMQDDIGAPATPDPDIKRVLVMFKCHFDAGFVNTQAAVVHEYFSVYFPRAIEVAEQVRASGPERYVWTTGSWLLYEYLEQASAQDRRRMEQAIARGDIAWHALPFNWQTEVMNRSMVSGSLALSQSLDKRFGRKTTGAKMTDVPGHTRGLVAPLAEYGVTFLDIGVNGASRPAELPPMFLWKDTNGATLPVMYHHEYGATTVIPGSDVAVSIVVRSDNSGPHTPAEVANIYAQLKSAFPHAEIVATDLTAIANAVGPHRENLPVVTQELGDTWIYGVGSDPLKVARYREVQRLRDTWIAAGKLQAGSTEDLAMLRNVLLEAEHTWGTDTKTWLDFDHYTPQDLAKMLHTRNYEVVQHSWAEKRKDLFDGVEALPKSLREEALAKVAALVAVSPEMSAGVVHPAEKPIDTKHFVIGIDSKTGAMTRLRNKKSGKEWASVEHPLALFTYQTLSQKEYSPFFENYIISTADWAKKDFGKPNMEKFGAMSRSWTPSLLELKMERNADGCRVLAQLGIEDAAAEQSGVASFPKTMYLEIFAPDVEPVLHVNFYWFEKPATRLPEALWLSFEPKTDSNGNWTMDKTGEEVSPLDVVVSGNRHMHSVDTGFQYKQGEDAFVVKTLDTPVIAFGERSPLFFSNTQPDLKNGVHCNLFNNAWGTNYIMWYGEDMRCRFTVHA
jgi:hypothetical protein